jgi:hypothetical protein
MKNYLLAGGPALVVLLWTVSCAGFPGAVNVRGGSEENVPDAGFDVSTVGYRRLEDIAAFADGSPESAIALMRAAGKEPEPLYLRLREGSETVELDKTDPLMLPFEAVAGSTSPARVVINGGGRTVSLAGTGGSPLLTVGDGVTLTLRNITLAGTDGDTAPLIEINGKGAKLVLESGAVIQSNATAGGWGGGILVTEGVLEADLKIIGMIVTHKATAE